MTAIAKTVWLIESHFGVNLSLEDMAANAGVSRTYLSRIFPMATGYSISGYTRARRLSEAAKALAEGAPDILAVALDAGYGSHEAFTRAFRNQFGMTPAALRQRRSLAGIALVDALPMQADVAVTLSPPRIEAMPGRRFAGIIERHDMSRTNTIPQQWQKFGPYVGHISGAIPGAAYGSVRGLASRLRHARPAGATVGTHPAFGAYLDHSLDCAGDLRPVAAGLGRAAGARRELH